MLPIPAHAKGLIFDCDGTLVDSMPLHRELWDELIVQYGVTLPPGFIDSHAGMPTESIIALINQEYDKQIDAKDFSKQKEARFISRLSEIEPIEPVVATARHYLGKLPMAVVSGGIQPNVHGSLTTIGALEWFPVILTANDPIPPKPAPDLFAEAARMIGLKPEECHAFEDGDPGIVAAKAAGMTVTDVRTVLTTI